MKQRLFSLLLITSLLVLSCHFESKGQNTCSPAITSGLVAYYPFCGNANDVSGNGLNGTVNGVTLSSDRFGNANSCYLFNGSSNYIQVGDNSLLNFGTNDFSISAWVNTLSTASAMIIHKGEGYDYPEYFLRLHDTPSADILLLTSAGSGSESYTGNCATSVSDGQWHHIVAIRNSGTLTIYFDGTQVHTGIYTSRNVTNTSESLYIGCMNFGSPAPSNFFNGKIDDISIYNRALSACEITALYNNSSFGADITTSGQTTFCQGNDVTLTAINGNSYSWNNGATTSSIVVSSSGNYSVTVTNSDGCSLKSATTVVVVNPLPSATIIASGQTTICQGNNLTLSVNSASNYLWSTGETTQSIAVSVSGNYSLTVTNMYGCSSPVSTVSITTNPAPSANIIGNNQICSGDIDTLTASGGYTYLWNTNETTTSIIVSPTNNSSYTVTATDIFGCIGTATTSVVVNPLPPTPTIFSNSSQLASSSMSGNQWYINGVLINGATSQYYTVTQSGFYTVCVTNIKGCSSCSTPLTGLNENKDKPSILIYPNPASDYLMMECDNCAKLPDYTTIKMVNLLSQEVFTTTVTQQKIVYINISELGLKGVYLMHLIGQQNNTIEIRKIVIQ